MKKMILVILTVLILLTAVGAAALYTVGDRIMNKILINSLRLDQLQLNAELKIDGLDTGADPVPPAKAGNNLSAGAARDIPANFKDGGKSTVSAAADQGRQNSAIKPLDAVKPETSGQKPVSSPIPSPSYSDNALSLQKIEEIEDKVTAQDRITVASLVLKKLTRSDVDELTKMLLNGISTQESEQAKQILFAKFTPGEIETLKGMYLKYLTTK